MRIITEVSEGAIIPDWYGVAYYRTNNRLGVCAPIPLNVLIGWGYRTWVWLKSGYRPDVLTESYNAGYKAGRVDAEKSVERSLDRIEQALSGLHR